MTTINLNSAPTQTLFAQLVGCSQQAIAERVKAGQLAVGGTLGSWLQAYCDQLRKEAAGRAGDAQNSLTHARIEEARENTAEKRQRRLKDAGDLLLKGDVKMMVVPLAQAMHAAVNQAEDEIRELVAVKRNITLDDDELHEPLRLALGRVADHARKLRDSLGLDDPGAGAETDTSDSRVG
ncbi:MAG TPA: hypothetical protein VNR18_13400 [Hyphomicrobiales bacterium]|nr:hypothetical protein [Hyphomicrobiales bacterium]